MASKKRINLIYLAIFLCFFLLHFHQLTFQHWSGVLDQDLIIIYNSLLLNSGIEQEYRDHPAFTTFLINSLIYKFIGLLNFIPGDIDEILASDRINEIFQFYFNVSRSINFLFNILIIILFNKILKKLNIKKNLRFLISLIFIVSIGHINSYFSLRSENLSLLFLFLSVNAALSKKRYLITNFFIAGIFFALAMLAKIQIIFLSLYLIYLMPILSVSKDHKNFKNPYLINYFYISLFAGFVSFFAFQIYIQEFPRFLTNKYLDLIFFIISFILIFIYFYISKNFKKNLLLLSSTLNGFAFMILVIFVADKTGILYVNDFIILRITNPIHYMTEFTGDLANGVVNVTYLIQKVLQFFSNYRFNLLELIFILILIFFNFRRNMYSVGLIVIFIINTLVMNFRYNEFYHFFYMFIYLILLVENMKIFNEKTSTRFTLVALLIFFLNTLNFLIIKKENFLTQIYNRQNNMMKICNEFKFKIPVNSYESVDYIQYWHMKLDDEKIDRICKEIL